MRYIPYVRHHNLHMPCCYRCLLHVYYHLLHLEIVIGSPNRIQPLG